MTGNELRLKVAGIINRWLGAVRGSPGHREILDIYNGYKPLARGFICPDFDSIAEKLNGRELNSMTGREILNRINADLAKEPVPAWARAELREAVALGITDGSAPTALIPRYQAAIMAVRAAKGAAK